MTEGPIYTTAEIRRIEQAAGEAPLMERAGAAAAELAMKVIAEKSKDILVLAGPGNNGGDARIAAEILKEKFYRVSLVTRPEDNKPLVAEGRWHGEIARAPRGSNGFGYDPLFLLPGGKTAAELGAEEKNRISHRAIALAKLLELLRDTGRA